MADIYKRGKRGGVWYCDIYVQGARIRKPLHTDRKIAEEMLGELIKARNQNKYGGDTQSVSWNFFKTWMFDYIEPRLKTKTKRAYRYAIKMLEGFFLPLYPSQVTPSLVLDLQTKLMKDGKSAYMCNDVVARIKAIMRLAKTKKYAPALEWETVPYLRLPNGRVAYLTTEELEKVLSVSNPRQKTILLLASRTGLRRGEIFWLTLEDIDLENKTIRIETKYDEDRKIMWEPKNQKHRTVPILCPCLLADLEARINEHKKVKIYGHTWLFDFNRAPSNRELGPDVMSKDIGFLFRQAGVKGFMHLLRHTYATHLASMRPYGVPLNILKEWMGHSSITQTEIYAKYMPPLDYKQFRLPELKTNGHTVGHTSDGKLALSS